jgi:hypothetical protein
VSEFPEFDVPAASRRKTRPRPRQCFDIPSAEKLEEQACWSWRSSSRRCLRSASQDRVAQGGQQQAIDDRVTASNKLADLSAIFLFERNFKQALEAVDLALSANRSPELAIRRAHILMFLGRAVEAQDLYLQHQATKVRDQFTGADVIKADFDALRRQDLSHPLMAEIEALLAARRVSR